MRSELSAPEIVYASFAKAANGAVNSVQEFGKTLEDRAVQDALTLAKKRRDEEPEGVMGWLVGQHEWMNQPVTVGGNESVKQEGLIKTEPGIESNQMDAANPEEIIETFKKAHPHIKIEKQLDRRESVKVCFNIQDLVKTSV